MSTNQTQLQVQSLYIDHHSWLQGWLRSKLGCTDQADDFVQDTFTRILAARKQPQILEPRAYLTTIAKGLLINWYQRQALERAYLDALALLPPQDIPSEEQRFLMLEALSEADRLLDDLPPLVKRAFLLSQIEGMKYEAIAEQIDVSIITVKRYMKQAFRHCLLTMD